MSDTATATLALPRCPDHKGRTRTREALEGTERYCTKAACTWSEITEPATLTFEGDPIPAPAPAAASDAEVQEAEQHRPQTLTAASTGVPTLAEMVKAVRDHAQTYYDNGNGWDAVVEAWSDSDIEEHLTRCRTLNGAIRKVGQIAWEAEQHRKEIADTAF